jgi:hypothetical protein
MTTTGGAAHAPGGQTGLSQSVNLELVDYAAADQVLRDSEEFRDLVTVELALLAATISCYVTLAVGVLHPVGMYLVVAILTTATVVLALFVRRAHTRRGQSRRLLLEKKRTWEVELNLGSPPQTGAAGILNATVDYPASAGDASASNAP